MRPFALFLGLRLAACLVSSGLLLCGVSLRGCLVLLRAAFARQLIAAGHGAGHFLGLALDTLDNALDAFLGSTVLVTLESHLSSLAVTAATGLPAVVRIKPPAPRPDRQGFATRSRGQICRIMDAEQFRSALTKSIGVPTRAGVPFAVAGGPAGYTREGPSPTHDIDLLIPQEEIGHAKSVLTRADMTRQVPPEDWLIKVFDGDVLIDLIHDDSGADLALDGHAHSGNEPRRTPGGNPVRNVAQPVIAAPYTVYRLDGHDVVRQ